MCSSAIGPARQRVRRAYTLADHPTLAGSLREIFEQLRLRVQNLGPEVAEEIHKQYIGYRTGRVFLSVVPLHDELKLYLAGIEPETIKDPGHRVRDVRGVGHWGVGNIEVRLPTHGDLDPVMDLIGQVFQSAEDAVSDEEEYPVEAVERVIELAVTLEDQQALRRLLEVAVAGGMYPRAWKRTVTLAPPQNRTITLVAVRIDDDGGMQAGYANENWEPYAGIPGSRVHSLLGPSGWSAVSGAMGLDRLTDALEELLADVTFPGRPKRAPWNQRDFYVILGDYDWKDCRRYGFVAAGGGAVYTRPLDQLFIGGTCLRLLLRAHPWLRRDWSCR